MWNSSSDELHQKTNVPAGRVRGPPKKTKGMSRVITTCNSRYINESALAAHLTVCLTRNVDAGRVLVAPPGDTELAAPSALQVNSGPFKQLICAYADKLASRH